MQLVVFFDLSYVIINMRIQTCARLNVLFYESVKKPFLIRWYDGNVCN